MNLTLRSKTILAFLCIAFVTFIVGTVGYLGMKKLESKFKVVIESAPLIQTATQMKLVVSQDLIIVMKLMAALDTEQLAETWKEHEDNIKQFEDLTNAILSGAKFEIRGGLKEEDEKLIEIVKTSADYHLNKFIPSFNLIFDQMNKKLSAENYDYDLLDTIDETTIEIGNRLVEELDKVTKIADAVIIQAEKEAYQYQASAIKITLIATILGIIIAVLLGYIFSGVVIKPIVRTVDFMKTVADGDFTKSLEIKQNDEIGNMSAAINKMVSSLSHVFKDITAGVTTLNNTSSQLSNISTELKDHAQEMSNKSSSVSQASDEMNQRLSSVAILSEESSSSLDAVSAAMEEMNATVNEISKNAVNARVITETAVEQSQKASVKVNELGDDAKEIGQVTDVIGEISDQTSLLALNATIEAARAGEAGKGFAVVANEIKDLAEQTAEAANNIKQKIDRIQNSTDGTVVEIEDIAKVIHEVNSIVSSIANAVKEQSATSNEIARNISKTAEGIHETNSHISDSSIASEKIASDISIVNENSTLVAGSSGKVSDNVLKLTDFSRQLKEVLNPIKLDT